MTIIRPSVADISGHWSFKNIIIREIFIIFLAALTMSISLTVVPVILAPLLIYRWGVVKWVTWCRPDLASILSGTTSMIPLKDQQQSAKVNDGETGELANLLMFMVLDGPIQLKQLRQAMEERVTNKINWKNDGHFVYPQLRQFVHPYLGYLWWRWEPQFCLDDHVRLYDYGDDGGELTLSCHENDPVVTEADLQRVNGGLVTKPWKKNMSPWEMLLIPNYDSGQSVLVFRLHHMLGDGYSILQLLLTHLCQQDDLFRLSKMDKPSEPTVDSNLVSRYLTLPFKIHYDFVKNLMESWDGQNPWHNLKHNQKMKSKTNIYSSVSPSFPVGWLKEVKNRYGVSYMAVLFSVTAGGIQRIMEEAGQIVPSTMAAMTVVPVPNHPGGLVNHFSVIHTTWPVGLKTPKERLMAMSQNLAEKQSSRAPLAFHLLSKICGLFPSPIRRLMQTGIKCTIAASSFPGPLKSPIFLGHRVVDAFVSTGLPSGQLGVTILMLSTGGKQRIVINIDKSLFPSETLFRKLGHYIVQDLMTLVNDNDDTHPDLNL